MGHIPLTVAAYFLNAVSVTVDKYLITSKIPNPLAYIFYISLASTIVLIGLPFTHIPHTNTLILASLSTVLWTTGAYLMYQALKIGHTTRVIPMIGSLTPIFLFIHSILEGSLTTSQLQSVFILILGLIFINLSDLKGKLVKFEILLEILSALFFASSYIFLRQAYLSDNFLTVLIWSRLILVPILISLILFHSTRKIIFLNHSSSINLLPENKKKTGILFAAGQICGGASELLLTYSISLASPALVNSLQGTQYVFLFILTFILGLKFPLIYKEHQKVFGIVARIIGIMFIGLGLFDLAFT